MALTAGPNSNAGAPRRRPAPLQVLRNDSESKQIRQAAEQAGLTPGGFVAAAGLAFAGARLSPPTSADRALLREALELRTALAAYATPLLHATTSLTDINSTNPSMPLLIALNCCTRAVEPVQAVIVQLIQREPS